MKCAVCGVDEGWLLKSRKFNMVLCRKHYMSARRTGDPFAITKRTPNQVILHDDYAEIVLRNAKCEEIGRTKVSLDKLESVKKHKWHKHSKGYVATYAGKTIVLLHRFLYGEPDEKIIDHINGDKLDNRNENLRLCSRMENNWNQKVFSNCTSGVAGVYYSKTNKGWVAQMQFKNEYYYLGTHKTKEEAAQARKEAEEKLRKDFKRKEG